MTTIRAMVSAFLVFVASLVHTAASAALLIAKHNDVQAGIAAFGTATPLLSWSNAFAPGSVWTNGVFGGPLINGVTTATDAVTGAQASGNLSVTNWLGGAGFDRGAVAGPDLAINGVENFVLAFVAPVARIGFAVATGRGLLPGEISSSGTSFALLTDTGESGSFVLVDPGGGLVAWIDVTASSPFTSIRFTESDGDLTDQYFGNVVSGTVPAADAVPETAAWAMLVIGMGGVGVVMRRRPRQRAVVA